MAQKRAPVPVAGLREAGHQRRLDRAAMRHHQRCRAIVH
jgi:hypothetical protein